MQHWTKNFKTDNFIFLESKHVQTRTNKGKDNILNDKEAGEKLYNDQYLSTKQDGSTQVTTIRIIPSSPGI